MPTASAKLEKFASNEACDPLKQILILVEKKVRNLEKRKGKLDNYRNDHKNGKELNEDQKNAVKKYDQVIEVLEFAKELQKSFNTIFQESARIQKKFQKKELVERQQHELQQIRQLLIFQDVLGRLQSEEVQNDFLNGENGAVKLSKEDIEWLGEFHKTVSSEANNGETGLTENSFLSVAEHFLALLEAKNRDILGTTYKHLKELLIAVQDSGYFSLRSIHTENGSIPATEPELQDEQVETKEQFQDDSYGENGDANTNENGVSEASEDPLVTSAEEGLTGPAELQKETSSHQLQDVLAVEGTFDFLQESQIDMESPHMDPAVVAAHPMAPPPNMNYQAQASVPPATSSAVVENETGQLPATVIASFQPIAVSPPTGDTSMTLSQAVLNHPPQDYDPNQPIPTQTFTNQNFVAMQSTMNVISSSYVPVTVAASYAPVTLIKRSSSDVSQVVHTREISSSVCGTKSMERAEKDTKEYIGSGNAGGEEPVDNGEQSSHLEEMTENQGETCSTGDGEQPLLCMVHRASNHYPHHQQNHQSRNFNNRGIRGGRGRGSSNGYSRGRGGYGNGRGYYQNSYGGRDSSGSSTGYNGYRRGSRGGPRGGARGGNRGGRGNYRPQQQ